MIRSSINKLFSAMWVALLATGAAGGLTFIAVASGLVYMEDLTEKLSKKLHS